MRKVTSLLFILLNCCAINALLAQYNTLMIPDTLSGTTFNLALKDTFAQLRPTGIRPLQAVSITTHSGAQPLS